MYRRKVRLPFKVSDKRIYINGSLLFLGERLTMGENIDCSTPESGMLCSSASSLNGPPQNLPAARKKLRESARLKLLSGDPLQKLVAVSSPLMSRLVKDSSPLSQDRSRTRHRGRKQKVSKKGCR